MTVVASDAVALDEREAYLTEVARAAIWGMWQTRAARMGAVHRAGGYYAGSLGVPEVADGSSREIRTLANQAVMNVCRVVVDTFARGLSVVGFRSPTAQDDEPAWEWWQSQRLDARQDEVHTAALTYGDAYVSVLPTTPGGGAGAEAATWSPLNAAVEWDDRRRDAFPRRAILVRPDGDGFTGLYVDDVSVRPFELHRSPKGASNVFDGIAEAGVWTGEAWAHGATANGVPVCPVVAFFNSRSADDVEPVGEIDSLIVPQQAINSVNFDRLCASRFSVFQQKVVVGWSAPRDQVIAASNSRVWTFEDHPDDIDVTSLPSSPITPYNELLREMKEQVALIAGIPLYQATGTIANVSTDTVAMVQSAHQRKLEVKQQTYGESWEQVIRLGVVLSGGPEPSEQAEVIWRETTPRTFGGVVDGVTKLAQAGVPIDDLVDLIPGVSQQRAATIRDGLARSRSAAMVAALTAAATAVPTASATPAEATAEAVAPAAQGTDAADLKARFDALGAAIRSGVDPDDAAVRLGLEGLRFTGAVPVSLRLPETDAASLEG